MFHIKKSIDSVYKTNIIKYLEIILRNLKSKKVQVRELSECILLILKHGLRHPKNGFWPFVLEFTHQSETQKLLENGPIVRCEEWIHISLQDTTIIGYFKSFLQNPKILEKYYLKSSILRDTEKQSLLVIFITELETLVIEDPFYLLECDIAEECCFQQDPSSKVSNRLSKITTDSGLSLESLLSSDCENLAEDGPSSSPIEPDPGITEKELKRFKEVLFKSADEKFYKLFSCYHSYLALEKPVDILLSTRCIYVLGKHRQLVRELPYAQLKLIEVSLAYQGFTITTFLETVPISTGSADQTRTILSCISLARRRAQLEPISFSCHQPPLDKLLAGLSVQIQFFGLVHVEKTSLHPQQGHLMYSSSASSKWLPGYFVLRDDFLFCYEDKALKFSVSLRKCTGCRRLDNYSLRPHMFEILLQDEAGIESALTFAGSDDNQVKTWLQYFQAGLALDTIGIKPCSVVLADNKVLALITNPASVILCTTVLPPLYTDCLLPPCCIVAEVEQEFLVLYFNDASEKAAFLEAAPQVKQESVLEASVIEKCHQRVLEFQRTS